VPENETDLRDWKISSEAYQWAETEQRRLRETAGESLSQAELFDRMRASYVSRTGGNRAGTPALARHQLLVEEFIRLLEDDSAKFRAFRDAVVGVLSDRLEGQPEGATAD